MHAIHSMFHLCFSLLFEKVRPLPGFVPRIGRPSKGAQMCVSETLFSVSLLISILLAAVQRVCVSVFSVVLRVLLFLVRGAGEKNRRYLVPVSREGRERNTDVSIR